MARFIMDEPRAMRADLPHFSFETRVARKLAGLGVAFTLRYRLKIARLDGVIRSDAQCPMSAPRRYGSGRSCGGRRRHEVLVATTDDLCVVFPVGSEREFPPPMSSV